MYLNYFVTHIFKLIVALPIVILLIGGVSSKTIPRQFIVLATNRHQTPNSNTSCNFPAIFNFGDSNSDTGGWSASFGQAGPPHGETFFHAPAGRYSDGRLIIDFIAERLGVPYLSAYLDSMGSNFSHGANFATASATVMPQTTISVSPFSFNVQFYQFHDFQQRSQIIRNKENTEDVFKSLLPRKQYFSEALYTFDIGQNDLTAIYYANNNSADQAKASIPDILDQFKTLIKDIYGQGARYFWIHNTGPLGCLTYVLNGLSLNATEMDQTGCAIPLNELAQFFNTGLKNVVAQLREEMPLAAITYVDIYSIKYDLISHANKFGFENPFLVCCGYGGKNNYDVHNRCGTMVVDDGKEVFVGSCKDPSIRISWDGAHYTEAANKWVYNHLLDGSYSDPPVPLNMACYKQ